MPDPQTDASYQIPPPPFLQGKEGQAPSPSQASQGGAKGRGEGGPEAALNQVLGGTLAKQALGGAAQNANKIAAITNSNLPFEMKEELLGPLIGKNKESKEVLGKASKLQKVFKVLSGLGQTVGAMAGPTFYQERLAKQQEAAQARSQEREHRFRMEEDTLREAQLSERLHGPSAREFEREKSEASAKAKGAEKLAEATGELEAREKFAHQHPEIYPPGSGALRDFVAGKKVEPTTASYKTVAYRKPGEEELRSALQNPKPPFDLVDADTKQPLEAGSYHLLNSTEVSTEARGLYWGEYGNFYRAAVSQGLSKDAAKKAAGLMVDEHFKQNMRRLGLGINIDEELSQIHSAGSPDFIKKLLGEEGKSEKGGETKPSSRPLASAPKPSKASSSSLKPSQEETDMTLTLASMVPGAPKTGGKAASVPIRRGLLALARRFGMDPVSFSASLSEFPGLAKQVQENIQREGATMRLGNIADTMGNQLLDSAKALQDTGSPFLNKPLREWSREAKGSPEFKRFQIAMYEFSRPYTQLASGAVLSKAIPPVASSEHVNRILSEDSTVGEISSEVRTVQASTKREIDAIHKTVEDLKAKMSGGSLGASSGADPNDPLGVLK